MRIFKRGKGSASDAKLGAARKAESRIVVVGRTDRVTKYKVIDDAVVEGATQGRDGSVTIRIRRGSLDLPAPEEFSSNLVRNDIALA